MKCIIQVPRIARHSAIQVGTINIGAVTLRTWTDCGLKTAYCCGHRSLVKIYGLTQTQNFRICLSLITVQAMCTNTRYVNMSDILTSDRTRTVMILLVCIGDRNEHVQVHRHRQCKQGSASKAYAGSIRCMLLIQKWFQSTEHATANGNITCIMSTTCYSVNTRQGPVV